MTGEATDLVARLRERAAYDKKFYPPADPMWTQAAALIEAQAAEIEGLKAALEPFAAMATVGDQRPKDEAVWAGQDGKRITFGDFRRAFLASRTERADG